MCLLCSITVVSQIKGKVTNVSGIGIPGVNIIEKGTSNGTISDFNGDYVINLQNGDAVLAFNFIGFKRTEVNVAGKTVINVVLEEEVTLLNEVVAVGYGTQIKREVTSSISTITSLNDEGGASIGEVLQGKASGLQITNTGSTPGASMRVQVRGTNSINSGTEPLWIIDGVPVNSDQENSNLRSSGVLDITNPLADLNVDDIASIQVLKDAASTSIYGSRGANGVILVSTKQGSTGVANISLTTEYGTSEAVNYKTYLNTAQHYELLDEMGKNSGRDFSHWVPFYFDDDRGLYPFYNRAYAETVDNNWIDMVLRQGMFKRISTSLSGGGKGARYYISFWTKDATGIMIGDERTEYGLTSNLNFDVTKKLSGAIKAKIGYNKYDYAQKGGSLGINEVGRNNWGARAGWRTINRSSTPMMPSHTPSGELFDPYGGYNPYPSLMENNQINRNQDYRGSIVASLDYKLLENLVISARGGYDHNIRSQLFHITDAIRLKSSDNRTGSARGTQNTRIKSNTTLNAFANYSRRVNSLKLELMAGTEMFERKDEVQLADFEDLQTQRIQLGNTEGATFLMGRYSVASDRFVSFFGRANFSLNNRYLLGTSYRRDGASVFAPKNRWGDFWSISGGWILSDEEFMSNLKAFNLLKLRSSYGSTGNASIPSFSWINTYQTWPLYGNSNSLVLGNLAIDNLTWEKSFTFDLALDYGLFENRINGSIGYYHTRTEDMLLNTPIALSHGVYSGNAGPTSLINVGQMFNQGFEIQISAAIVNIKNFKWEADVNLSTNRNEVGKLSKEISNPLQIGYSPAFGNTLQLNSVWTGERLGRYYIAEYAGMDEQGFETIYEIDQEKFAQSGGQITEKTGNIVRATSENIQKNRMFHNNKTGLPTYFGGITNSFTVKNFTLDVSFTFSGGNYIYDQTVANNGFVLQGVNPIDDRIYGKTFIPGVREDAEYPIQTYNNLDDTGAQVGTQHSRYLYKGDYIRLQNIGLKYKLPYALLKKVGVKSATLYSTVSNLWVWSPFKSFDPEFVNYGDIHAVTADRNLGQGYVKYDPFPKARTITIGARLSF
ncbi:SusC/RagA family TonB-linked outer membrane protein [Mariniphaga anaerophila]|nr:SusC/RagA family TonB-linked outer membrane protein [Mariniphaga anaerophila]